MRMVTKLIIFCLVVIILINTKKYVKRVFNGRIFFDSSKNGGLEHFSKVLFGSTKK